MKNTHPCRLVPRFLLPRWDRPARIKAIIDFCRQVEADEMMLFPVSQYFAGRHDDGVLRKRAKKIADIRRKAADWGIEVIINHCGFMDDNLNLDSSYRNRWPWSVDITGKKAVGYRCFLSEDVRNAAASELAALASSGVRKIFLDDEVHYDWKPGWLRKEALHFCFCPDHIKAFSSYLGKRISRKELVDALGSNRSSDKAIRRKWLEFKRDTFIDFLTHLRRRVHKEHPSVRIGQMTTFTHLTAWDGITFAEHLKALAGPLQPLCRPAQGWYGDHIRTGIVFGLAQTMWTLQCIPDDTEVYSEVDWGSPWTQLEGSTRTSADFQIKANLLLNIKTHSLLYLGEGPEDEFLRRRLIRRLRENRKVFDALAGHLPRQAGRGGLQFLMGEKLGLAYPIKCRGTGGDLADPYGLTGEGWGLPGWMKAFQSLARSGVAMTFDESPVAVLTGGMADVIGAALKDVLARKNLIIDAGAAADLNRKGLLRAWGLRLAGPYRYVTNERLTNDVLNRSARGELIPISRHTSPDHIRAFRLIKSAELRHRPISEIIDCNRRVRGVGIVLVEHASTGRKVCVLPFNLSDEKPWGFAIRRQQWRGILDWLTQGQGLWPVWVDDAYDVWPLVYRCKNDPRIWLGLINFGHDPADDVCCRVAADGPAVIRYVNDKGQLCRLASRYVSPAKGRLVIRLCDDHAVNAFDVRLFVIEPA